GHRGIANTHLTPLTLIPDPPNITGAPPGANTCGAAAARRRPGDGRVVFGSEYPLQHPAVELAKFQALRLPPDQWRRVAWDNAHRLLGEEKR
ncbi:amidohydrolase family protein, partial [Micromonospora chalcea]|uniref:amidohydrolase family protein n=1 Tax=Micromonospora chalcea TaxID=1874 RepID=UPI0033CF28F1